MLKELFTAFLILVAAPFCMGLIPALALPGEHTAWSLLPGDAGEAEKWGRKKISACPLAVFAGGFLLELAVFQLIAVPIIILKPWGFPQIVTLYSVALAVLSVAGLLLGLPVLKGMAADVGTLVSGRKKPSPETVLYWVLAAGLILFQIYMAYTHAFFDGDDAYYVAQSVIADQSDVLYRILPYTGLTTTLDVRHALASLPIWEAYLARVTGIHPAIVAHSVLPLVLIPVTYILYFRIGMRLFHGNSRKTAVFLILVSVLQIFGNTSIYTNATFFLMRTWQGKSILCNLVLLAAVWVLLRLWDQQTGTGIEPAPGEGEAAAAACNGQEKRLPAAQRRQAGWWLLLCANNVAAAMMTTMGAFLVGLLVAVTGLVTAVRQKRPAVLLPLAASCIPCIVYLALYVILVA